MRPTTTSTMLQQNNNNNYPCLNMSGSTREMLQKCSRASLPFPSRLELGDLPLIRGLRAWALCSKNRRKAGGLLGGGQAPTAPPSAGRGGSISCPRPADVYLSGEWGRMGYGLPLGLDAGQAGIGALVTVATLKTSEGSGKTQTQCLFLRTEKGSCLYSTAKPGSGVTTSAASSGVGGWLRGKTGGGGGGSRDHGPTPSAQTGANRVRVRSGRRWRKSCNAAGREKTERQQGRSGKDPAGEITLDERPEERDKGSLVDSKQFPSPQQDIRRKEGAVRSPRCCHNASPKTCAQCGRRAPRRASQDEHEGGESPRRGDQNAEVKGMRKERQRNAEEEEEEEEEGVLAVPNPDLESNRFHPETQSSCDAEEIREAESNTELKTETSHSQDDEDTNSEVMKIHTNNDSHSEDFTSRHSGDFDNRKHGENPGEEIVNGFSDDVEEHQESEKNTESVDVKEDDPTPTEFLALSTCAAVSPEASSPIEGSTCKADHETCGVLREHLDGYQQGVADSLIMGKEELDGFLEQQEANCAVDENNTVNEDRKPLFLSKNLERDASSSPLRQRDPSIFESDGRIEIENNSISSGAERRDDLVWESREREAQEENTEQRLNLEEGEIQRKEEWTCHELDVGDGAKDDNKEHHTEDGSNDRTIQEDDNKEVTQDCAVKDNKRLQESADGCRRWKEEEIGDTCGQTSITHVDANSEAGTNVTNVACADSSTSSALSPANPAPSLPPLGSMATGLPCLEAKKEEKEEEEGVVVVAGDGEGDQEGKRELEEQGEEERGSTVATEEGRKEEEEEVEEEDEFGVFMQAEGEPAWSEGSTMSASVPCGSRESVALGNHAITGESTHWTPGWTDGSFHQSDDTWTAFPQDSSDERRDVAGQWWPTSAVEESRDRLLTNQNLASVFAEAFPSLPASSSSDPSDLDTVPTLTQLLRGKASQDQGLLDSFHDLNKMICQRYKRANGVSRDLLLKTLHLQQPHTESRPAPRTASRRLSPGLPSANQHAQNAAAKRRLSYDYNRNIME